MSGYSLASHLAFASLDLQEREREVYDAILKHFGDGRQFTRQQLADAMKWKVNRVTGRIVTLRERGLIVEDKSRTIECPSTHERAHPMRLKNADGRMPATVRRGDAVEHPTPATTATAVNAPSAAPLVAITPYFGRRSMTTEQARALLSHPCVKDIHAGFVAEAKRVVESGEFWI